MPKAIALIQSLFVSDPDNINILTKKGVLQDLLWRIQAVNVGAMGAQLAYFFLLSFFPLMIFFLGLIPYLNLNPSHAYALMSEVMPPDIFNMVKGIIDPLLTQQNSNILSFGALATLWSASQGTRALMAALNKAYNLSDQTTLIDRLWSIVFTLCFLGVLLVVLALPIFGGQIMAFVRQYVIIDDEVNAIWNTVRWLTPPLLIFGVLLTMYWVIPKTSPRLRVTRVYSGTVVAGVGWLILTYGFSTYIHHFGNYSAMYGSIGGVMVLMLWLYLTGIILILGGIINATLQRRHDEQSRIQTPLTEPNTTHTKN